MYNFVLPVLRTLKSTSYTFPVFEKVYRNNIQIINIQEREGMKPERHHEPQQLQVIAKSFCCYQYWTTSSILSIDQKKQKSNLAWQRFPSSWMTSPRRCDIMTLNLCTEISTISSRGSINLSNFHSRANEKTSKITCTMS